MYLSKLLYVFVQIAKCICPDYKCIGQRRCWLVSAADPQMRLIYSRCYLAPETCICPNQRCICPNLFNVFVQIYLMYLSNFFNVFAPIANIFVQRSRWSSGENNLFLVLFGTRVIYLSKLL